MFSGIVEAVGAIEDVEDYQSTRRFRVHVPEFAGELTPGDSVAVDGACLTVTSADHAGFSVDVIGTTLDRTVAGSYMEGTRVNLESTSGWWTPGWSSCSRTCGYDWSSHVVCEEWRVLAAGRSDSG